MAIEDRIRHMLRAAARAEEEGDPRVARLFRRMAEDTRPVGSVNRKPMGLSMGMSGD